MSTTKSYYDFVAIGGGTSGFFGALSAGDHFPHARIALIEKSGKLLSKVKVSGGGRCNVTHACFKVSDLIKKYPRGEKELRNAFEQFFCPDTMKWFESRGVKLKTENDGRVFPVTDDSQTIIDCLLKESNKLKIDILKGSSVTRIEREDDFFSVQLADDSHIKAGKVMIATGGSPKKESYQWLEELGHQIEEPVPSLFTFNVPDSDIKDLQGISVPNAKVKVLGTKLEESGPLLITHWGFSGPAILKLSAWGARVLHHLNYSFKIHINWLGDFSENQIREVLSLFIVNDKKKIIASNPSFNIPKRLWVKMIEKASIEEDRKWGDVSKKQFNKLIENIFRAEYTIGGKTTFKEEFVTCGGIRLKEVDFKTMESKLVPGLFFGGEVLDIDGITGGFNFQSAWTTGWIAGKNALKK